MPGRWCMVVSSSAATLCLATLVRKVTCGWSRVFLCAKLSDLLLCCLKLMFSVTRLPTIEWSEWTTTLMSLWWPLQRLVCRALAKNVLQLLVLGSM